MSLCHASQGPHTPRGRRERLVEALLQPPLDALPDRRVMSVGFEDNAVRTVHIHDAASSRSYP